jgi:hypothetical protein
MLTGLCLISLAAIAWGTTGATMTLSPARDGSHPGGGRLGRLAVAPLSAAFLLVTHDHARRCAAGAPPTRPTARDGGAALIAGRAAPPYQLCCFSAVTLTGVANGLARHLLGPVDDRRLAAPSSASGSTGVRTSLVMR